MALFFVPELNAHHVPLSPEESHHALHVLRLSDGAIISISNGQGSICQAYLRITGKKTAVADIIDGSLTSEPAPASLTLAVAPTKQIERMEWLVEKATELGFSQFIPLICAHSERRKLRTDRLKKIVLAACKQSRRLWLPKVEELTPFATVVCANTQGLRLIAHCEKGEKQPVATLLQKGEPVTILIGPEGDFSTSEIQDALHGGWEPITLGRARLRTETAALLAVAAFALAREG